MGAPAAAQVHPSYRYQAFLQAESTLLNMNCMDDDTMVSELYVNDFSAIYQCQRETPSILVAIPRSPKQMELGLQLQNYLAEQNNDALQRLVDPYKGEAFWLLRELADEFCIALAMKKYAFNRDKVNSKLSFFFSAIDF